MSINQDLLIHHLGQLERIIVRRNRIAIAMSFVALLFWVWERSPGVIVKLSMIGEISDVTVAHMIILGPIVLGGLLIWALIYSCRAQKVVFLLNQQIKNLASLDQKLTTLYIGDYAQYKQAKYRDVYWWINVPTRIFLFFVIPLLATIQILHAYSTIHPQFIRHDSDGNITAVVWETGKDGKPILGRNNHWDEGKYGKSPYDWSSWERISYLYFSDLTRKGTRGLLRRSDIEKNPTIVETFPYVSPAISWVHLLVSLLNIVLAIQLLRHQISTGKTAANTENTGAQNEQESNSEDDSKTSSELTTSH